MSSPTPSRDPRPGWALPDRYRRSSTPQHITPTAPADSRNRYSSTSPFDLQALADFIEHERVQPETRDDPLADRPQGSHLADLDAPDTEKSAPSLTRGWGMGRRKGGAPLPPGPGQTSSSGAFHFRRHLAQFEGAEIDRVGSTDSADTEKSKFGGLPPTGKASAGGNEVGPHRFAFFSTVLAETVHARELADVHSGGRDLTELLSRHEDNGDGAWWLDVLAPSDAELKLLSRVFRLHPLTSEDIQLEETREKLEVFRNYTFIVFRSFEQDRLSPSYLKPINIYIILFQHGVISLHSRATPCPQKVRQRIIHLRGSIEVTSNWISYAILDEVVDEFAPVIETLAMEADGIDDQVLMLKGLDETEMLQRIGTSRKAVMGLLRLSGSKSDVIRALIKRSSETLPLGPTLDITVYLYDVLDHISTSTQNLAYYEKVLSRSHTNYLTQVSIELTATNNHINGLVSKMTVFGTTLIPMNVITGLWGLNVKVPGLGGSNLSWFFGIIGVFVLFAMAGIYLSWKLFIVARR